MGSDQVRMYKVVYQLPIGQIREIVLSEAEFKIWMGRTFLRVRIVSYEKVTKGENPAQNLTSPAVRSA
jgi:hypothetical protein